MASKTQAPQPPPHQHSNACYTIEIDCPKTLHSHSRNCRDDKGNLVCGKFDHPSHDPVNCTRSVKKCGF